MAVLTNGQRQTLSEEIQRDLSATNTVVAGVLKADWRPLINAIDQFYSDNDAALIAALPVKMQGLGKNIIHIAKDAVQAERLKRNV